jgi:glutamyl-tRNA reductase
LGIVVVGAGEAGRLAARACQERGNSQIVVVSRSRKKAMALAASLHGSWSSMDRLGQELATADIAISCSGAPHTILKLGLVEEVMKVRPQKPLVIIDIAVPPDVDHEVKQLDNVFLYHIDEISKVCETNNRQRQDEICSAMEIVNKEVERFGTRWRELEVKPVITALVKKAEEVRQAGLDMTLKKMPGLSGDEQVHLEAMTKSIVRKILHEPIQYLKNGNHNKERYIQVVKEIFSLDE